jgi:hypothetical protein
MPHPNQKEHESNGERFSMEKGHWKSMLQFDTMKLYDQKQKDYPLLLDGRRDHRHPRHVRHALRPLILSHFAEKLKRISQAKAWI